RWRGAARVRALRPRPRSATPRSRAGRARPSRRAERSAGIPSARRRRWRRSGRRQSRVSWSCPDRAQECAACYATIQCVSSGLRITRADATPWTGASMPRAVVREMLAEFLGTFVLIVFGVGVVAQVVLSRNTAGSYLSINIAWGLAVTMGCYVSAGVTGAHLNPAVTLALAAHRRFAWDRVLPYMLAQVAGAFVASVVVFIT